MDDRCCQGRATLWIILRKSMLTARGCWLLVTAVLITALGIFHEVPALVQVGLALLFWIAVMGGRF